MAYAVARMQKMKVGNLKGIENHNKRKTKNHTNQDIDVTKSHLNYDLVESSGTYHKDIMGYINKNKASTRAVRKDAVVVNEWLVTSSAAFFEGMEDDEIKRYFEVSKDFFADKFGEENIRYAQVHMDEKTPHMHMGIVPFDDDMKLSSKRVVTKQTLISVQDELPKYLQEHGFDVQRGEKESQRKHLSVPEYKDAKEKAKELQENNQNIYDQIYDEAMKAVSTQKDAEERKLENEREKLKKEKEKLQNEQKKMNHDLAVVYTKKISSELDFMDMFEEFFDVVDESDAFVEVAKENDLLIKSSDDVFGVESSKDGEPVNRDRSWVFKDINSKTTDSTVASYLEKFGTFRADVVKKSKEIVQQTKGFVDNAKAVVTEFWQKVDEKIENLEPVKVNELVQLRENGEVEQAKKELVTQVSDDYDKKGVQEVLSAVFLQEEAYKQKASRSRQKGYELDF
ncbi:MobV family relaxase [Aerococcus urinaeequi]|uniref:MobV family relaxase n=1 Tax=Aerococcus urinaeequi TaxID=51665 RepID=UPI003ED8A81C